MLTRRSRIFGQRANMWKKDRQTDRQGKIYRLDIAYYLDEYVGIIRLRKGELLTDFSLYLMLRVCWSAINRTTILWAMWMETKSLNEGKT